MAFKRTFTYPYPPNFNNLAEVDVYLKKLYTALMQGDYSSEQVADVGSGNWFPDANGIHYPATGTTRNVGVGMDSSSTADLSINYILDIYSTTAAPTILVTNASDTARDPTIQFRVGATPSSVYTIGVDNSDSNKFKIVCGSDLENYNLFVINPAQDFAGVAEFTLIDTIPTSSDATYGVCAYNGFIYRSCYTGGAEQDRIYKYLLEDPHTSLAITDLVNGTTIYHIFTDSTYVYAVGEFSASSRIKKYSASTLTYIDQSASLDLYMGGACYYAGNIYLCGYMGAARGLHKVRCSDLSTIWDVAWTTGSGVEQAEYGSGIATDGTYLYIRDSYSPGGNNRIIRCTMAGAWVDAHEIATATLDMSERWSAFWYANGYLYVAGQVATVNQIAKINTSSFTVDELFVMGAEQKQGFTMGDYHFMANADTPPYELRKYSAIPTAAASYASYTFSLPDAFGDYYECARVTSDRRLGVNTSAPTQAIEAVGNIQATTGYFISTCGTGVAPLDVDSTTVCTNLNADLLDGQHGTYYEQVYIAATASPTANDDIDNYREGTIWVEQDANTIWLCADNADGAAVWHGINQDLRTTDTPTFNGADFGNVDIDGANGYVKAGVADTTRGIYYAYGSATGSDFGGSVFLSLADDHNAVISAYGLMPYEDDLLIGPDTNVDALKLASTDDLYITAGSLVLPASEYVNFGGTLGSGGYGIRDNAGTMEFCNSGESWAAFADAAHDHDIEYASLHVSATASPTVNDDVDNYSEGTVWVEQDSDTIWFCADNADGAAVWHGIDQDLSTTASPTFANPTVTTLKVGANQVVGARVVDADFANIPNSGDADTDDLIDKIRDALITHGLIASS